MPDKPGDAEVRQDGGELEDGVLQPVHIDVPVCGAGERDDGFFRPGLLDQVFQPPGDPLQTAVDEHRERRIIAEIPIRIEARAAHTRLRVREVAAPQTEAVGVHGVTQAVAVLGVQVIREEDEPNPGSTVKAQDSERQRQPQDQSEHQHRPDPPDLPAGFFF